MNSKKIFYLRKNGKILIDLMKQLLLSSHAISKRGYMFLGVAFALCACFIWGLIFVVPQFMEGFSSIEIALGRYLLYGIISLLIFCKSKVQGSCHYSRPIWIKAIYFSLILTIVYYTFVVLSLRYSTPAICVLVLGLSPITIAFYGNWKQREIAFVSV